MKTKWVILTVLLFGIVLLMAGCWNSRELNKLAIVMAMGIDKVEQTNEYKVSFQVVNPGAVAPGATGGGAGANAASAAVFTGVGKNLFEAIRKTSQKVPRQLFFSHMQLLVIGEAVAKEGIQEVFDFFDRGHEARLTTKVLVTRDVEAGAMLKILTPLESIPANAHTRKVELSEKLWSGNVNNEIDDVIKALVVVGREPIISGAKIVGNPKEGKKKSNMEQTDPQALVEIKGVALFKEGKLKRWVDGNEIRGILQVQNKMKSTIMNIDCKDEKDAIGIEVIRSKTDVTAEVQAGRPVIHIDIRQEGNVGEVRCPIDLTKQEEITKLEKEWIRETKREVIKAVEIAQSEKSDIFGFGEAVKRADPKTWEKMRKEWSKTFAVSKVDVKVDAFIRRPGMRTKPYLSDLKK